MNSCAVSLSANWNSKDSFSSTSSLKVPRMVPFLSSIPIVTLTPTSLRIILTMAGSMFRILVPSCLITLLFLMATTVKGPSMSVRPLTISLDFASSSST